MLVALYFCSCSFFEAIYFLKLSLKIIERGNSSIVVFFAFGVLLRCSSTVAVLLGSPAPLCDVAPCDFTYFFTYLPFACLLLIADCDADSAHVLPRGLLTCRTVRCNLHA